MTAATRLLAALTMETPTPSLLDNAGGVRWTPEKQRRGWRAVRQLGLSAEQRAAHQQLAFKAFVCGNDLRLRTQQGGDLPVMRQATGPAGLVIDEFWLTMQLPRSGLRLPPTRNP